MIETETLYAIDEHPDYFVSSQGNVYSFKWGQWKILQKEISTNGYARVTLDGKHKHVSKLVLSALYPQPGEEYIAYHLDGDKLNDSLSNLVWATKSDAQIVRDYTLEAKKRYFNL